MKQNKNKIECTPTKHEEGAVKSLIQMCKDTNAVAFFGMTCEGDYEVMMTARKKGMVSCDEFSLEQFEARLWQKRSLNRPRTNRSSRTSSMFAKAILRMQRNR